MTTPSVLLLNLTKQELIEWGSVGGVDGEGGLERVWLFSSEAGRGEGSPKK